MKEQQSRLKACGRGDRTRGFSMVEMVVVVAVAMTLMAIVTLQAQPALLQIRANTAKDQIQSALRTAREMAISDRRSVKVEFLVNPAGNPAGSYVRLTRQGGGFGPDTVIQFLAIQNSVVFTTFNGVPDTPDGYGNAAPIYFGGVANGPAAGMFYQSDGTFITSTGIPINGTVFLGIPGQPSTARAITVLGTTGRVRSYHISTTTWFDY
ncbi:MAG: prepilin-type N-terminal cleavage/methylation domain-containing protein [Candidatus Acidiferrales bacterium]